MYTGNICIPEKKNGFPGLKNVKYLDSEKQLYEH